MANLDQLRSSDCATSKQFASALSAVSRAVCTFLSSSALADVSGTFWLDVTRASRAARRLVSRSIYRDDQTSWTKALARHRSALPFALVDPVSLSTAL